MWLWLFGYAGFTRLFFQVDVMEAERGVRKNLIFCDVDSDFKLLKMQLNLLHSIT